MGLIGDLFGGGDETEGGQRRRSYTQAQNKPVTLLWQRLLRNMQNDRWAQTGKDLPYKQELKDVIERLSGRTGPVAVAEKAVGRVLRGAPVMGRKAANKAFRADLRKQMQMYDEEFAPRLKADFLGIGQGPGSSRASLMRENYLRRIGVDLDERQFARQQQQSQLALSAAPVMGQLQIGQLGALRSERAAAAGEASVFHKLHSPASQMALQAAGINPYQTGYSPVTQGSSDSSGWASIAGAAAGVLFPGIGF